MKARASGMFRAASFAAPLAGVFKTSPLEKLAGALQTENLAFVVGLAPSFVGIYNLHKCNVGSCSIKALSFVPCLRHVTICFVG